MKNSALKRIIAVVLCLVVFAGSELTGVTNIVGDLFAAEEEMEAEEQSDDAEEEEPVEEVVEISVEDETSEGGEEQAAETEPVIEESNAEPAEAEAADAEGEGEQQETVETEQPPVESAAADNEPTETEDQTSEEEQQEADPAADAVQTEESAEDAEKQPETEEAADAEKNAEAVTGEEKQPDAEAVTDENKQLITEDKKEEEVQLKTEEEEQPEVLDEETEPEEKEEPAYPEFDEEITAEDGRVKIHVSAEEGVLPEGVELSVKPIVEQDVEALEADEAVSAEEVEEAKEINAKYEDVRTELEASVAEDAEREIAGFLAYDISFFLTEEDEETGESEVKSVEPNGNVSVAMEFTEAYVPEVIAEDDTMQVGSVDVMHMKETNEGLKAETLEDAQVGTTAEGEVETAEFVSDSFSIYALTWVGEIDLEGRCTYEDDNVIIRVSAEEEGAVPADARVRVYPILPKEETAEQYGRISEMLKEKAEQEDYNIAGFIAYDISLVDREGTEMEPAGRVNVSMNYKKAVRPAELDAAVYASEDGEAAADVQDMPQMDVTMFHFEEDAQGEVQQVVDMSETGQVRTIDTTDSQEVQKAEFVTGSFSVFALTWNEKGELLPPFKPGTTAEMKVESIMDQIDLSNDANAWQIVAEGYEGNGVTDKELIGGNDGNVKLQKNVIPMDAENEFLVYLSVDTKSVYESFFSRATYKATTSNNYHSHKPGTTVGHMTGNMSVDVSTEPVAGYNYGDFTVIDTEGNTRVDNLRLYWSQAQNVTIFVQISVNPEVYLLLAVKVSQTAGNYIVHLDEDAEGIIDRSITNTVVNLQEVKDQMGSDIIYDGVVAGDYESEPVYNEATRTLTWIPVAKTVETDKDTDGTVWNNNVAELLYRVKLDVEKEGFPGCASNLDSTVDEVESRRVNESATLKYQEITTKTTNGVENTQTVDKPLAEFPVPYVRGLLYDICLIKKAEGSGEVLPGATFQIFETTGGKEQALVMEDGEGNPLEDEEGNPIPVTAESDSQGIVRFAGLPWGTYTIKETAAPEDYDKSDQAVGPIELCYTTASDRTKFKPDADPYTSNMVRVEYADTEYKDGDNKAANVVYNKEKYTSVKVIKIWEDLDDTETPWNTRPDRIEVKLQYRTKGSTEEWKDFTDKNHSSFVYPMSESEEGTWELIIDKLPIKIEGKECEYQVVETVPNGYTAFYSVETVSSSSESEEGLADGEGTVPDSDAGSVQTDTASPDSGAGSTQTGTVSPGQTVVTIRNVLQTQIVKRSSSNETLVLEGAKFALTGENGNISWNGISGADGTIEWTNEKSEAVSMESLPNGTYTLQETEAPNGYSLSEAVLVVAIENGRVVNMGGNAPVQGEITGTDGSDSEKFVIQTFYIDNAPLYELPSTGGIGIHWYIVSGTLMMMLGLLILYKRKFAGEVLKG